MMAYLLKTKPYLTTEINDKNAYDRVKALEAKLYSKLLNKEVKPNEYELDNAAYLLMEKLEGN